MRLSRHRDRHRRRPSAAVPVVDPVREGVRGGLAVRKRLQRRRGRRVIREQAIRVHRDRGALGARAEQGRRPTDAVQLIDAQRIVRAVGVVGQHSIRRGNVEDCVGARAVGIGIGGDRRHRRGKWRTARWEREALGLHRRRGAGAGVRGEVHGCAKTEGPRDQVRQSRGEIASPRQRLHLRDLEWVVDHLVDPEGQPVGELEQVQRVSVVGNHRAVQARARQVREAFAARRDRRRRQQDVRQSRQGVKPRGVGRIQDQLEADPTVELSRLRSCPSVTS